MMNNEVEFFLVRSLVLKPEEKSSRRLSIRMRKHMGLELPTPAPPPAPAPAKRAQGMLVLPKLCIVSYSNSQGLGFKIRFSEKHPSDHVPNPSLDIFNQFAVKIEDKDGVKSKAVTRTTALTGFIKHRIYRRFWTTIPDDSSPWLAQDYTIENALRLFSRYQSGGKSLLLARLYPGMLLIHSTNPKDILLAGLYHKMYVWRSPIQDEAKPLWEGLAEMVSKCLGSFQIELDLMNKRAYRVCTTEPLRNKGKVKKMMLRTRLQIMIAFCEFVEGPIKALLAQTEHPNHSFDWLFQLRGRIVALEKILTRLEGSEPVKLEELFNWQLCSFEESSARWWIRLFNQAPEESIPELVDQIKLYMADYCSRVNQEPIMQHEELETFLVQLERDLNLWSHDYPINQHIMYEAYVQKSHDLTRSLQNPNRFSICPIETNYDHSFILPAARTKNKQVVEVNRSWMITKFEAKRDGWCFRIFSPTKPSPPPFGDKFTQDRKGTWVLFHSFATPELLATDPAVPEMWECFQVDFCPEFYFLLFATPTELRILLLGITPTDEIERLCCTIVESPSQDLSHTDFLEKVKFFYNELHEPHRSETFTWVESQKCLLWAVPLINDTKVKEGFVDICLCLRAYSLEEKELKVKTQLTSDNDRQWMFIIPGLAGKSEMDPRHNLNLSFYFSWRRAMGRILGVWLRSEGGYRIYELTKKRFVLCCQKLNRPFVDHFMTELVPAIPGLFGDAPMLLKRNDSIRLFPDSFDFILTELKLVMN